MDTRKKDDIDWLREILSEEHLKKRGADDYKRSTVEALLWLYDEVLHLTTTEINPQQEFKSLSRISAAMAAARDGKGHIPDDVLTSMYANTWATRENSSSYWSSILLPMLISKADSLGWRVHLDADLPHWGGQCRYDEKLILIRYPLETHPKDAALILSYEIGQALDFIASGQPDDASYAAAVSADERERMARVRGFELLEELDAPIDHDSYIDWHLEKTSEPVDKAEDSSCLN